MALKSSNLVQTGLLTLPGRVSANFVHFSTHEGLSIVVQNIFNEQVKKKYAKHEETSKTKQHYSVSREKMIKKSDFLPSLLSRFSRSCWQLAASCLAPFKSGLLDDLERGGKEN